MTRNWSFYDPATGLFCSQTFLGSEAALALNTPPGMMAIAGLYDRMCQRVNLQTGEVVPYRPPRPDEDHEWSEKRRRWVLKRGAALAKHRRQAAMASIVELEAKAARPMRELWIDPENAAARQRLAEIEEEIAKLRGGL